ncbi:hypothetical protein HAHE_14000 [Haloferula helveola]|uniref:DUF1552 domain-containing protein n=1 Tax=Haloferula helveola TaxID=490095 RepID=A0ABM7REW7_9BACT|nr:hypothetical protein HAHE_14000 [Haloferula helveola]
MTEKSWHMNRRDVLRGGGIALALPFLNSMSWARGLAGGANQPKRLVVSYISYGVYDPNTPGGKAHEWSWYPRHDSGPITFNKASAPFKGLEQDLSYLRGLDHAGGYGLGGHSSGDVFATGADMSGPEKTNNISIDQLAAKVNGHHTRYASLVMGSEGGTGSYGMSKTLSHRGPGQPIPSLKDPQDIFNRLFNPYASKTVNDVRAELKREASVLDLMMENYKSLHGKLGAEDKQKMEEYLDSVRALEQRVERTSQWTHEPLPEVDTKGLNLEASYENPTEYIRCMYDLLYLALQTDSTRFATFMTESEHSTGNLVGNFANRVLGYTGATHDIAHKRPDGFSGDWEKWRAEQHSYFLKRLKDTPEGEGNMLDNTVVLWGSAHPHGSHSTKDYPIQIAGGNRLGFKHGHLHAFEGDRKKPLSNLFVSMLNAVDTPVEKFADSTGELTEIRA